MASDKIAVAGMSPIREKSTGNCRNWLSQPESDVRTHQSTIHCPFGSLGDSELHMNTKWSRRSCDSWLFSPAMKIPASDHHMETITYAKPHNIILFGINPLVRPIRTGVWKTFFWWPFQTFSSAPWFIVTSFVTNPIIRSRRNSALYPAKKFFVRAR
jgi:hypothetical protein